jgi:hypothetical protein
MSDAAKVLSEIHLIMLQNGNTKDVFREMDGFLVLMSVLSNVHDYSEDFVVEPEEETLSRVMEIISLIFMCMSEAMNEHLENAEYFRVRGSNLQLFRDLTDRNTDCCGLRSTRRCFAKPYLRYKDSGRDTRSSIFVRHPQLWRVRYLL